MKKSKNDAKRQWRTSIARVKKGEYLSIGVPRPDNKGFVYRLGYGYLHELKQYHDDPLTIIKAIIANFPLSWTKEQARTKLDEIFKEKKETKKEVLERFKGYEVVEKLFDYFNIFNDCSPTKSTTLKDVVLQLIYQRIKNPISVFNTYMTAKKEKIDTYSKNSFYRSLDYIAKNKDEILRNLNAKICGTDRRKWVSPHFFNSCFIYIYISKFKKTFLVNKTLVVINGETMQSLLLKKKEKPVVTIAFLRKYNKKKYNKLTEEALKILFKSKLIIGEKMYKELKERKIAFEFLAIIRHLGAKANYISILHLQKLGFKRSTLTETIKFLSNLGYIEHKTGAIKLTKKPWTLKNEKFMKISSKKLWIHFLLNGSAITLWNIARIIAYKKNHSKANKSLFRNVNFVEDYETMPYKLEKKSKNKRFTTIKLIKTVVKMPESEKDFDLLRIKNKFFDGSSATIGKSINFFKKGFIDIGFFYLKEYKNNLFLTERYMFI